MIYSAKNIAAVARCKRLSRRKCRFLTAAMIKHNRAETRRLREAARRPPRKQKPANSHRNRGYALEEMDRLSDHIFLKTYRLDRASFNELVEQIDPLIRRDAVKATASSGSEIPTRTRLAVTLRWLGGGTWCDIVFAYGISCSVFYSDRGVLWPTIEAIDAKLGLGFPLDDADEIEK
jgi:hypothetical protein